VQLAATFSESLHDQTLHGLIHYCNKSTMKCTALMHWCILWSWNFHSFYLLRLVGPQALRIDATSNLANVKSISFIVVKVICFSWVVSYLNWFKFWPHFKWGTVYAYIWRIDELYYSFIFFLQNRLEKTRKH